MTASQPVGLPPRRPPSIGLLRLAFALGVTPTAWFLRRLGVDRLGLRPRAGTASYWSERPAAPVDLTSQS